MRAVRVECAIPPIQHDERVRAALQAVSWDYRGTLDQTDGRLRVMCECITMDGNCPPAGFTVGGVTVVEILEEWSTEYLTCLLYTSPSPRDRSLSRMPSSA